MKKLLILFVLLALGRHGFAQSAALTVYNHNQACSVYVNVQAQDANLSNGSPCDIVASFLLPPLGFYVYSDPSALMAGVGFSHVSNPFSSVALTAELASASPNWMWVEVEFQYSCPEPTLCGIGGNMTENFPALCFPSLCWVLASTSWSAPYMPPPVSVCGTTYATWTSPGNCVMSDVSIDFY